MLERMLALALGSLCLTAAFPALAQDADADADAGDYYSRPGVYFQALFTSNIGGYSFPAISSDDAQYAAGVGGALGYRINEHVAAEVYGDWVSGWQLKASGADLGDVTAGAIGLNAKGYLKGGRFQPYALLGLGAAYGDLVRTSLGPRNVEWDMALRVGFGFDWYATEEVGFSVSPMWVRPLGVGDDLSDLEYVSIGVGAFLRFGEE